ncbi:MAG: alpha/beta hydrolase [bacterium]|nr:alpha/beta hydrolase [bacterium]
MRKLLSIALTFLIVIAVAALMLDPLIRQMLYPAPPIPVPSPPPPPLEEVTLELPAGERVTAWAAAYSDPASPAVVFFHGNGENLETMRLSGLFEQMAALGVHVLAVDYPGYGSSSGEPSEASLTAAGQAGFEWLGRRHPDSRKFVLGWSLGAAVATRIAADNAESVDGLVLLSAWSDLPSLAAIHYPSWLVGLGLKDKYDSVAAARGVRAPILMAHGAIDQIIPIGQGRQLADALGEKCRFVEVPGAGHNDLLARQVVWRELATFLRDQDSGS